MSLPIQPISHLSTIELESFPHNNPITTTANNNHQPVVNHTHHNDDILPPTTVSTPAASAAAKTRTVIVITCVAVITCVNSFLNGALVVATPAIAKDLSLSKGVILW